MSEKMTKQFKRKLYTLISKYKNEIKNANINYISVEPSGDIWGYHMKPIIGDYGWEAADEDYILYGFEETLSFDSTNWKKTLIELKDLELPVSVKVNTPIQMVPGQTIPIKDSKKEGNEDNRKLPWGTPIKAQMDVMPYLKFQIWKPAGTFLVYKILEARNIPNATKYKYESTSIEYDLLHPDLLTKNYEDVDTFGSKEDRDNFVKALIPKLRDFLAVSKRVTVTEKDIGKDVETECGVATLVNLTIDGKFVVQYPRTGSQLFICEEAELVYTPIAASSEEKQADGSVVYTVYAVSER